MRKEYFAYGSVLEALSFGLYPDKRHVIREFVQNAFDAVQAWRKMAGESRGSPIEIIIRKPSIVIADKGIGMKRGEAQKFRYFGYSDKNGTKTVGFRGIGKDSGLAVAERIIVTTSRYQEAKRHIIVIDAQRMQEQIAVTKNPPLEELLKQHSSIKSEDEKADAHYTLVELHNIRKDAEKLYDIDHVKDYLCRNAPVPLSPTFQYRRQVDGRLASNIPGFTSIDLRLNGEELYKPYPPKSPEHELEPIYTQPEYEPIFANEDQGAPVIAFCWYCGHTGKGQFSDRENSGLIYRFKNFSVGDRQLTRETLWKTTPERAFYFFGEIHVLDARVVPSSDRTDFEDNEARTRLYNRCRRIAQILSHRAGTESAQRTFEESILSTGRLVETRTSEMENRQLPVELKPEIAYEIRKVIEDIEKRLDRTKRKRKPSQKDKQLIKSSKQALRKAKSVLKLTESKGSFENTRESLELNAQAREVYQVVIDCLKEELSSDRQVLQRLIRQINRALAERFKRH